MQLVLAPHSNPHASIALNPIACARKVDNSGARPCPMPLSLAQSSLLDLTLFDGYLSTNMLFWSIGMVEQLVQYIYIDIIYKSIKDISRLTIRVLFAYACMRFAVCPWICRHSWWTPRLLETAYMTRPSTSNNSCSSDLDLKCGILGLIFLEEVGCCIDRFPKFFCICQFWGDLTSLL